MLNSERGTDASHARASLALRVLASGSAGNCSVVVFEEDARRRAVLIDLGLSRRRLSNLLDVAGLDLDAIDEVLLTHLDTDHFKPDWIRRLPRRTRLRPHRMHARRLRSMGAAGEAVEPLDDEFETVGGVRGRSLLLRHDDEGVAALRLESEAGTLGYATDVGRPTRPLASLLRSADVMAVESNYCPKRQAASPRPAFLKRRITGGAGHLSNKECLRLVRDANAQREVVLLHLSRQCNEPALAAAGHTGAPYNLTIASQTEPTPWVRVAAPPPRQRQGDSLFESVRRRDASQAGAA